MRVCFDVHGKTGVELEEAAHKVIASFTDRTPSFVTITAQPEVQGADGEVLVWRGEVEASL